jgi:hypothetical protein
MENVAAQQLTPALFIRAATPRMENVGRTVSEPATSICAAGKRGCRMPRMKLSAGGR